MPVVEKEVESNMKNYILSTPQLCTEASSPPRRRASGGPGAYHATSLEQKELDSLQTGCYRSSPGSEIVGIQAAAELTESAPEN